MLLMMGGEREAAVLLQKKLRGSGSARKLLGTFGAKISYLTVTCLNPSFSLLVGKRSRK